MPNITSVLKSKIDELDSQIDKLNAQKDALTSALSSIEGQGSSSARRTRTAGRKPAARRGRPGRPRGGRAKRGANQKKVLATLAKSPRRLTEIASATGLTLTAAGGVLRALIAKGLATKGQKRGTYLAKGAAAGKR
jgi:septal ring factor EnvC (AmiA/AmiB activator)